MGDVVAFRYGSDLKDGGACVAKTPFACCKRKASVTVTPFGGRRLPVPYNPHSPLHTSLLMQPGRDAGSIGATPEIRALEHAAMITAISEPATVSEIAQTQDLIAFAKSGGPIDGVECCATPAWRRIRSLLFLLLSHPKDFTPVCTTELGYMARIKSEFDERGVKIIGLSVDPVDNHAKWARDIEETQGYAPNYPMIGDADLLISKAWGMLTAAANGDASKRTASDNQTVRNVFIIGPDKKIELIP